MSKPFEDLERHVAQLGAMKSTTSGPLAVLTERELAEVATLMGGTLPPAWRWWLSRYGVGFDFVEPIVYDDPVYPDVLIGTFMTIAEMRQTIDDLDYALVPHRLPFNDDASGNFLVIDPDGSVAWHIHDKPTDRNTERVADSFEAFVRMLRVGE